MLSTEANFVVWLNEYWYEGNAWTLIFSSATHYVQGWSTLILIQSFSYQPTILTTGSV